LCYRFFFYIVNFGGIFYVELEGIVYKGTFPATDRANKSSNTPFDIGRNNN
jgi:hypothetical protein